MKNGVTEGAVPSHKQQILAEMDQLEKEIREMLDQSLQGMERARSVERENEVQLRELERQFECWKG